MNPPSIPNGHPLPLVVILGVGPLIGASVAHRFAHSGFRTALVGLDGGFLDELAASLPESYPYIRNLSGSGAIPEVFKIIGKELGDAGVLVYNASSGAAGPATVLDATSLKQDLQINAIAPLEAVHTVLPAMRKAGKGTILFTGGGLALKPQADMASGSMGKAALRQLALCLAEELAPEGIHVATVTVAGFVQRDSPFNPDRIAECFWGLHCEPRASWRSEVVLRP